MKKRFLKTTAALLVFAMALNAVPANAAEDATPTTTAQSAAEELKEILNKSDETRFNLPAGEQVLIRHQGLVSEKERLISFAQFDLVNKNSKVKYAIYDINGDSSPDLLALYPNGTVEAYPYEDRLIVAHDKTPKAVGTVKNVKELRKSKKGTFVVKVVKGSTTSYTTYKYSINGIKKSTTYSKKKKTYKKGSKKIKASAFNKYVKSYKKLKKVSFKTAKVNEPEDIMKEDSYYLYEKDCYTFNSTTAQGENHVIFRNDADDSGVKFRAFGETNGAPVRFILGPDVVDPSSKEGKTYLEEDWTDIRDATYGIGAITFSLISFLAGDSANVTKTSNQAAGYDEFKLDYSTEGYEADSYISFIVDTDAGKEGNILEISEHMSNGLLSDLYTFYYGDAANIDGETYTPGLDRQVYPLPVTVQNPTRTITVDYNGENKMFMSEKNVRFAPISFKGNYSIDGENISVPNMFFTFDGDDFERFDKIINPVIDENGFADVPTEAGVGKVSWTPNLTTPI